MTLPRKHVVTCFLEHNRKILIMKRSQLVRTYRGKWGAVAGYVEPGETPEQTAFKEIREETGLSNVELVKRGEPYEFHDRTVGVIWIIHPFRFRTPTPHIRLDWEHEEARWVLPEELPTYDTVPHLIESWQRVST